MAGPNRTEKPLSAFGYKPGKSGEMTWCHSCNKSKPKAMNARCLECAQAHKKIDDARLMPEPFFAGSHYSYVIEHFAGGGRWKLDKVKERVLKPGERHLSWFVLPPFQRPPVWTVEQKTKLIESIWLELPIGVYIYNQPSRSFRDPTEYWLIDGQQRITAILDYVDNQFPVFGYYWRDLYYVEQQGFLMTPFPAIQLDLTDQAKLEDIYYRLAYGGTPHEPRKED